MNVCDENRNDEEQEQEAEPEPKDPEVQEAVTEALDHIEQLKPSLDKLGEMNQCKLSLLHSIVRKLTIGKRH